MSPDVWRAGPVEVASGQAQKALYLLKNDPMLFEPAVEEALESLSEGRDAEEQEGEASRGEPSSGDEMVSLRKRMDEVRNAERMRTVMELLYLKVCARFRQLEVPLVPPLKAAGDVRFGQVDLQKLTSEIYSKEALELVREHLFNFVGQQQAPFGALVMIPLFQAGQVYAMSAIFGYYLRQVDARYQLEKLVAKLGDDESPRLEGDEEGAKSIKEYIGRFDAQEVMRMTTVASAEARMALEAQVGALFGDLRALKERLAAAVGMAMNEQEAQDNLMRAVENNEVEALRLSSQDLQRIVVEAVAFGSLLSDAEKQVDSLYDLTPSTSQVMQCLIGDDRDMGRMLPE